MKISKYVFVFSALILSAQALAAETAPVAQTAPAPGPSTGSRKFTAVVKTVISGDDVFLADGTRLRYIGIDAPETNLPKRDAVYYGKDAYEFNKSLVEGREVRIETDVMEKDKRGRILGYVFVGDQFINAQIVKNGFAAAAKYPPNLKYQDILEAMEKEARSAKKGLWSGPHKLSKSKTNTLVKGVREGSVEKVLNGDTIRLKGGEIVRYIGITAPKDKDIDPSSATTDFYGKSSYEGNKALVDGKNVVMVLDVQEKDFEGRTLAYVYSGQIMVNVELVRLGFARVSTYPPNVRFEDLFIKNEEEATANKRGIWSQEKK
jgi:micrococcal nuclease